MPIDFGVIAQAVVSMLGPFMPFLTGLVQKSGDKFAEVVAEKGGEAVWDKAQGLWNKISGKIEDDEGKSAAGLVSARPDNVQYQTMFASILSERLRQDPAFAQEIQTLLGGPQRVQRMAARYMENVYQKMKGPGHQTMEGDTIIDGDQIQE